MENLNSVCYVASITEIRAIEGADNIELAVVGGWNCITKRGEYQAGDSVIIATTDAVIPVELSDAMGVTGYLRKGQRVRTVKLRGVYSECLIIPMKYLSGKGAKNIPGTDLMETLGIFKYEPPVKSVQMSVGGRKFKYHQNPNFGIYYKFPNMKNVPDMFTEEDEVQITRKLHGTNARYGIVRKTKLSVWDRVKKFLRIADEWVHYEFVYGSHNVEKGSDSQGFYSTDVWRTIADKYDIKKKLWNMVKLLHNNGVEHIGSGFVIYGEIYGAGIQKNYDYGLKDIEFAGFDVTIDGRYVSTTRAFVLFSAHDLDLPHVPVLYKGKWSQAVQDKFVFGNNIEGTKIPHEGVVVKCVSGERNRVAKVINPDYLIYGEKHNVGDSH